MFAIDLQRLTEAMEEARLDQSGLARAVGCTPGAINQIVQGNVQRSRLLPEIARELGVDLDWLMGEDRPKRRNGEAPARLRREEFELLDAFRPLRNRDRQALQRVADALKLADDVHRGIYPLPSTAALEAAFSGLLQASRQLNEAELARELAKRLPTILRVSADGVVAPASESAADPIAAGEVPDGVRPERRRAARS